MLSIPWDLQLYIYSWMFYHNSLNLIKCPYPSALQHKYISIVTNFSLLQSYNSYLFNDYTAIYKLLKDQLTDVGEMDIARVTKFLQGEHRLSLILFKLPNLFTNCN